MALETVVALVHAENGCYGVSFPDFPGAVTAADNAEEAISRARDVVAYHVAGMAADGVVVPAVRSLYELRKNRQFRKDAQGARVALIAVSLQSNG
jgi:predicted RNase H-like HicB family nuclease